MQEAPFLRKRLVTVAGYIELDAILRSDLSLFVRKVFATVSPNDAFKPNWHIDAIAHELTRCHAGENRRLLITQPPRSLKSICASVAFPAWVLGHDPTVRIMCVSYGEGLAHEFARQFRMVTDGEWYRRVFPRMRLKSETRTEAVTTRGGGRVALSVGGSITGRGADFIIIDDPLKAEDSASETARARVDPSRKSGGALHRLHCFCLEFDGACEVQRRVPTDWIIEPIDVSGYGSFSLAS